MNAETELELEKMRRFVRAFMSGMDMCESEGRYLNVWQDPSKPLDPPLIFVTLVYRVNVTNFTQWTVFYWRAEPGRILEACHKFRDFLIYPAADDVSRLRDLTKRTLYPIEGMPDHTVDCPCHYCRTARDWRNSLHA